MRGQSSRDKVLRVSDSGYKRIFPAATPTGQGRIIGKDPVLCQGSTDQQESNWFS